MMPKCSLCDVLVPKCSLCDVSGMCRVCGLERETLQHFTRCCFVGEVFDDFRNLTGAEQGSLLEKVSTPRDKERYDLFAIKPNGSEKSGWVNTHSLLWKQVVGALTRVDTEGETFSPARPRVFAGARENRKIAGDRVGV